MAPGRAATVAGRGNGDRHVLRRRRQPAPGRDGAEAAAGSETAMSSSSASSSGSLPVSRPGPPTGANDLVVVVFDSLRYDTAAEAGMVNASRLGPLQQRWSYASWTAPSHFNLLMGLLPHASPAGVYASEYYKADFERYSERLGVEGISFASLLPAISLPTFLRDRLGYRTQALVSMPVLNPATSINVGFDRYELMPDHNDFGAMIERLRLDDDRPTFTLCNVGETHYPYAVAGEDEAEWPHISGVHGVLQRVDGPDGEPVEFFDDHQLARLRSRQVDAARHVDRLLADLYDAARPGTWFIVTSDHGELFGEGGYFGHGPIAHDKVFEVPFTEGRLP